MKKDDYVIVCGDFGLWDDSPQERWWLDWLAEKSFTVLFADGNHENFDRLYGGEFEEIDFCGGRAHKIRENVYHLMRGYIFDFEGKKFWVFGGARSHDIRDGILDPAKYDNWLDFRVDYEYMSKRDKQFRVKGISWWSEEMPNDHEMAFGKEKLAEAGNSVDYIITHCCPQSVASCMASSYEPDKLTIYFNEIAENVKFKRWFFGHYHTERQIFSEYVPLYGSVVRLS